MEVAFPILLIAVGLAVLALGKRLAVLGAAVGAMLGVGLLRFFPGSQGTWLAIGIPAILAALGFFAAGFAKGIVSIVISVIGALAGAAIVMAVCDLFNLNTDLLYWILVIVGAVVGFMVIGRFKDWGMIILSALIGALLVTRGLGGLIPSFQGGVWSLVGLVLMGGSIFYQGGFLARRQEAAKAKAAAAPAPTQAAPPPAQAAPPPAQTAPPPAQPPPAAMDDGTKPATPPTPSS